MNKNREQFIMQLPILIANLNNTIEQINKFADSAKLMIEQCPELVEEEADE